MVNNNSVIIKEHLFALDGWRGLSILCVLAGHLLPLGPSYLLLNSAVARLGMVLFFILSGFLITRFLIYKPNVTHFIIRRFFRIIPLAWLYIVISLFLESSELKTYLAQLLFYANYPPFYLTNTTAHLWSLSIEMQFYVGVALLVAILKTKGLYLLPLVCVGISLFRFYSEVHISIVTHFRLDEILAGACLALIYEGQKKEELTKLFNYFNLPLFFVFFLLLLLSCHDVGGGLAYFRPYFAALLIGGTLFNPAVALSLKLNNKILLYFAATSYSLYVIHPLLAHSWLGMGEDSIEKYSKRILLFSVLFMLAHLSTFYYEQYWIRLAKKITR